MADPSVAPVHMGRVLLIHPLHGAAQVALGRLDLHVVMIGHEAVAVEHDSVSLVGLLKQAQELPSVARTCAIVSRRGWRRGSRRQGSRFAGDGLIK